MNSCHKLIEPYSSIFPQQYILTPKNTIEMCLEQLYKLLELCSMKERPDMQANFPITIDFLQGVSLILLRLV